jgi:hypothetical protein
VGKKLAKIDQRVEVEADLSQESILGVREKDPNQITANLKGIL